MKELEMKRNGKWKLCAGKHVVIDIALSWFLIGSQFYDATKERHDSTQIDSATANALSFRR